MHRRRAPSHDLTKLARLGGCRAGTSDLPPGDIVMWRGLSRLTDIQIGVGIGAENVGNQNSGAALAKKAAYGADASLRASVTSLGW